jgi:hypothetical protein
MLTRYPRNTAQGFKFHCKSTILPEACNSYFRCSGNSHLVELYCKGIFQTQQRVLLEIRLITATPHTFPRSMLLSSYHLLGLQVATLKPIHPFDFCMHFLPHFCKPCYSSSFLSRFHNLHNTTLLIQITNILLFLLLWVHILSCGPCFHGHPVCVVSVTNYVSGPHKTKTLII